MSDHMDNFRQGIAETQRQMRLVQEQIYRAKYEEIERQKRNVELLEINANQNEQMLKLKETELDFLKNISEDSSKLVSLLINLEQINKINGTITEANMLVIQDKLDEIVSNSEPTNINQMFLEEVKKQIVEKGVGVGIQFIITGLKYLLKANHVE